MVDAVSLGEYENSDDQSLEEYLPIFLVVQNPFLQFVDLLF